MGQLISAYVMNNMDKWCMKWNEFDTNIREYLRIIREDQRLFDVTLVTEDGQHLEAHKIILSTGSHFFSDILLKRNQTNMLIYLKGIKSVQLEHLLDFIYKGEASVGQEELKEFLETGKELQVKGFEAYVAGVGESEQEESERYANKNENIYEKREGITGGNIICGTGEQSPGNSSPDVILEDMNPLKIQRNANSDLDLQILEMIEKSDGVWKCKICGKTTKHCSHIKDHAETHIEGISHACHICNKSYLNRSSLRDHITKSHSELLSCDICGKSGMNKMSYYHHKSRHHKILSGTLLLNKHF